MKYVGIDLGTTNSAIASFDGKDVALYKSPEQHDVTPSAIYVDRRGNRFVGARAYNNAALDPDNAAILFKRQMGTSTQFSLPNLSRSLSAEECSAEILKVLYGYLPETLRNSGETGTVITVPAAFDQMQKDATLAAAELAGIGRVALMQEPVAAVMSVMRKRAADGIFLIYDMGGGTLDVAIAQSIGGRVNLLAHGGIPMCGGRDMDRLIVASVIRPWLHAQFELPSDMASSDLRRVQRLSSWAAEKAKIELSLRGSSVISLNESEIGRRDTRGRELYLDVPLERVDFDRLIGDQVEASIEAARETLQKAGLDSADVERIVFVGGPTFYAPLREKVSFELGIAASTEVNPMTAVAEGAAIFAESIDWSTSSRHRKTSRGTLASAPLAVTFHYVSRTPSDAARVSIDLTAEATPGAEFQIDALETGWTSGRLPLRKGVSTDVPLANYGENRFRARLFDAAGGPLQLANDVMVITKTAASIDGIPASHSIALEVRERLGGGAVLDFLVREGELLPKRDTLKYKADSRLEPGENRSLNFKLWEGDIADPITDNHFIGLFKIRGTDLGDRAIPAGADLICEYEIVDSGNIILNVHIPAIEGSFNSGRNFYSRQDGQIDFAKAAHLIKDEGEDVSTRLDQLSGAVPDADLEPVRRGLAKAEAAAAEGDPEAAKLASQALRDAKRQLAKTRRKHLITIRELELERVSSFFNSCARQHAHPAEADAFDAAARSAEAVISKQDNRFEDLLSTMRSRTFAILWRQDEFVAIRFEYLAENSHLFVDGGAHVALVKRGKLALSQNDTQTLRQVVGELDDIRIGTPREEEFAMVANIVRAR